ncbi:MAG: hypothetical protein HY240_10825 [Actinobacteria bacterium]|nr:hypothetical protein [Actinomycetota bacterium]
MTGKLRAMDLEAAAATFRHRARRTVSRYPSLYLPLARRKHPDAVLDGSTQIVIDGFTRSAVTFAVVAFQLAQDDHVRVAHHLHAVGHFIAAARRGVPVLLAVRGPEDTILSALVREPLVGPRDFLESYVDLYERLFPYRSAFLVAPFREVTEDFGGVTRRVNALFGTSFREFEQTHESVQACFDLIEERSRRPAWAPLLGKFLSGRISAGEYRGATVELRRSAAAGRDVPEHRVQRPSAARQEAKETVRERYLRPELAVLRHRAELAYERLAGGPGESRSP